MGLIIPFSFLIGGLVILWKAAELLVDGAVSLSQRLGVSSLVIGLTVVAMGTSAPEVAASIAAAIRGSGDIAVGNVYGSNIANLALVGGLAALIRPISVRKTTLMREIPVMLAVALLLPIFLFDKNLARWEGTVLVAVFIILIFLTIFESRMKGKADIIEPLSFELKQMTFARSIIFVIGGLIGLALGAEGTVRGAVVIGRASGISEAVIGLTIVAVGTSLPELVTCIVAALKKQDDISIGNLVGSNIFNTLLVTGVAAMVRPFGIEPRLIGADYWIMIGVSVVFAVFVLIGRLKITRIEALILLGVYTAYIAYLFTFS